MNDSDSYGAPYGERLAVAVAAAAGSLLLLLLGPYSNFAAAGYLDPWYYTGYFTNFSYLVHQYGPNYFVSRLPWIIPGLLAFRVAPPEAASVLLNCAIMTVSVIALYWAVRWHYGRTPAVLVCCALATNPYFLSAVSWDYPDGAAIAYAFGGLAFAVRPHGRAEWNMFRAAVFLTLSGLTHLTGAPLLISILVFVLWRHRHAPREWLRDGLWLGAGAVGTLLVLCPISQALVGKWTFFYWQIYTATHLVANPGVLDRMWGTGPAFLLTSSRFFAPAFLLAAGGALLWRRRVSKKMSHNVPQVVWPAWLSLGVCFGLFAIEEFVAHVPTMRVPYHVSYLIVPVFFLAGVLLGEMGKLAPRCAIAAAVLAILLPFGQAAMVRTLPAWPALLVLGIAAAMGRGPWKPVCLVAILFLSPGLDPAINYMWDRPSGNNLRTFQALMTFQDRLKATIDPARRAEFWIDQDEESAMNLSAESLYLWIHHDFTNDLATAPAQQVREELKPNATLVHMTMHPERMEARRRLLAERGIATGNERSFQLPWTTVVLQDVTDLSGLR